MTDQDLRLALDSVDEVVTIECTDGEVIVGRLDLVAPEEQEIVIDLISTTNEARYEKLDVQPVYLLHFSEIRALRPGLTRFAGPPLR